MYTVTYAASKIERPSGKFRYLKNSCKQLHFIPVNCHDEANSIPVIYFLLFVLRRAQYRRFHVAELKYDLRIMKTKCRGYNWATQFLRDIMRESGLPSWGVSDETVKYGYGFCATRTIEWLHCKIADPSSRQRRRPTKEQDNFRTATFRQGVIKKKLRGLSPQANYTDRVTAACQRS
jgi:hypothetical protein